MQLQRQKKALFALRSISKYFTFTEMRSLLDSNFYSILYYNSNIWLTSSLSPEFKQKILSISANALRTCLKGVSFGISFIDIHRVSKKSTPEQILMYNHAIQLHKTINHEDFPSTFEHFTLINQTICTGRQLRFRTYRNNKSKIGMNTTANKFHCLTDLIGFDTLNLSFLKFKKLAKIQFLKFGHT